MKYLFCLLFIYSSYSQSSGIITYKVYVTLKTQESPNEDANKFIAALVDIANTHEFELSFNKSQSAFKYIDNLNFASDYDKKVNNIAISAYGSSDTYIDFSNKEIISKKNDGTLVTSKLENTNWEISSESKKIGDYLCYKAILKTPYLNRFGDAKIKESICWFAPSLPYKFGPKNFNGLPGLILELTEDNKTFLASKIELTDKEIDLKFPKGKTIAKEEYEKKLGPVILAKKTIKEKQ